MLRSRLGKLLLKVAQDEREPEKIQLLLSALTLMQHDPAIEKVIRELQQKIAPVLKRMNPKL